MSYEGCSHGYDKGTTFYVSPFVYISMKRLLCTARNVTWDLCGHHWSCPHEDTECYQVSPGCRKHSERKGYRASLSHTKCGENTQNKKRLAFRSSFSKPGRACSQWHMMMWIQTQVSCISVCRSRWFSQGKNTNDISPMSVIPTFRESLLFLYINNPGKTWVKFTTQYLATSSQKLKFILSHE